MQMETRSKIVDGLILLLSYVRHHKIMSVVALYLMASICLKLFFSIDLLVPFLWDLVFDFRCPGCGLTAACMELLTLNLAGAFKENPLIFILIPVGVYCIFSDLWRFKSFRTLKQNP